MRIRKTAKLSSVLPSHASTPETPQTHVCQLNQSPWDVIPSSHQVSSCPSLNYQFEGEDSFTGNGSFGDSVGAVESVSSMIDDGGEDNKAAMFKVDESTIDDNGMEMERVENVYEEIQMEDEYGLDSDYKNTPSCLKTDGKGWHCRNEPKNGHNLCDHHLSSLKKSDKGMTDAAASSRRGGRARRAAKKGGGSSSSSSNPHEFYYYSGFGPWWWGKRRGDGVIIEEKNKCEVEDAAENSSQNDKTPSSSSQIDHDGFDHVDDDEDDDEDEEENGNSIGRKRIRRKPVKARSLKSLM